MSVLALLEVSGATIAAITGGPVVASELVMIAGVAIAGKQGFTYIKATVFGFFQKHGPPEKVSKTRFRIGLLMYIRPLLYGWMAPYFEKYVPGT